MPANRLVPLLALSLLLASCRPPPPAVREVRVAAAADLQYVMPEIAQKFEQANPGAKVSITIGSSGNLYAQIRNGAPFDLFLSADEKLPQKLAEEGFAKAPFLYAFGKLVLWSASDLAPPLASLDELTRDTVQKIAIANPEHAPYGAAAVAALKSAGVYDRLSAKLVLGENIGQAAQFLETGAAQAGLISQSLANSPKMAGQGRVLDLPEKLYPPIRQAGVLLGSAANPAGARKLRDSLLNGAGREILHQRGFQLPPK